MDNLFEYTDAMDSLRFTPEQKALLARRAAAAAKAPAARTRRPARKLAILAAAAVLVLAVGTAGAAGLLKPAAQAFAGVFGGGAAQTEIIDKIGRPIGASDTDNGVTVTADAIVGDKYNACIIYTIAREDGEPLLPEGVPAAGLVIGGFGGANWTGSAHGTAYFRDDDPADNAIQYVETITSDEPLNRGTAKAEFRDIRCWDEAAGQYAVLAEGRWTLRFAVEYEDSSVTLGGGETFTQGGMTFTVDEVTVSPVAVRAAYTVDREVRWSNAPSGRENEEDSRQMGQYLEDVEILLTKTDGTVLDLSSAGGSVSPRNGQTVCTKGAVLEEILPLEELASVSVGGVVYPVNG